MKARPILFSAPMIRALLEGRKTQTRRVVKAKELSGILPESHVLIAKDLCPHGKPGDLLWCREKFHTCPHHDEAFYYSDNENLPRKCMAHKHWKPSIFMPRWASRLTLEITDVRVERLWDISNKDAAAEGIFTPEIGYANLRENAPRIQYAALWESIHGPGSWDTNPWVWVIEFDVHQCNVDEFIKQREAA